VAIAWPQVEVQNSQYVIAIKVRVKVLLVSRTAGPLNIIFLLGGVVIALHKLLSTDLQVKTLVV
jgi:hypothetical protein